MASDNKTLEELFKDSDRCKKSSPNQLYAIEFEEIFRTSFDITAIKDQIVRGKLRRTKFRGLLWSRLLNLLENDTSHWEEVYCTRRSAYRKWKDELFVDHETVIAIEPTATDHPLSMDPTSLWDQYFENNSLTRFIDMDVRRTFPGVEFLHRKVIQRVLRDVLLIYVKKHPEMGYKQGMHELLSAVILVLSEGIQQYHNACKPDRFGLISLRTSSKKNDSLFKHIFDFNFMENDSYFIFEKLLELMWDWYYIPPKPKFIAAKPVKAHPVDPSKLFVEDDQPVINIGYSGERLDFMWNTILRINDKELYDHLEPLGVIPTTFGLNWMKLLFSRQFFTNYEFLHMWDVIMATEFAVTEYILVSMIMAVKPCLMQSGIANCNVILVSEYPKNVSYSYVIDLSLYLYDGSKYAKPREGGLMSAIGRTISDGALFSKFLVNTISSSSSGSESDTSRAVSKSETEKKNKKPRKSDGTNFQNKAPKSMELYDYSMSPKVDSAQSLRHFIMSWCSRLEFSVEYLVNCWSDDTLDLDAEGFNQIMNNIRSMVGEMKDSVGETAQFLKNNSSSQNDLDLLT